MIHDNSQQNEDGSLEECIESSIIVGALGWKHAHWESEFYPDDLPEDWQLSYYSNEFSGVLVPEEDWKLDIEDLDDWVEEVPDGFQFYFQASKGNLPDITQIVNKLGDHFAGFIDVLSNQSTASATIEFSNKSLREWRVWLEENAPNLKAIFLVDKDLSVKNLSDFKSLVEMLNL